MSSTKVCTLSCDGHPDCSATFSAGLPYVYSTREAARKEGWACPKGDRRGDVCPRCQKEPCDVIGDSQRILAELEGSELVDTPPRIARALQLVSIAEECRELAVRAPQDRPQDLTAEHVLEASEELLEMAHYELQEACKEVGGLSPRNAEEGRLLIPNDEEDPRFMEWGGRSEVADDRRTPKHGVSGGPMLDNIRDHRIVARQKDRDNDKESDEEKNETIEEWLRRVTGDD